MKMNIFKGFTLVEVIIAIGVLGLVMTLTAGVMVSVVKSYRKQLVLSEIERNGDFVMRVLEENLKSASGVDCVTAVPNGDSSAVESTPSISCNPADNPSKNVFLEIRESKNIAKYAGLGTSNSINEARTRNCDDGTLAANKFVFLTEEKDDLLPGEAVPVSKRLTNFTTQNGVCVDSLIFDITTGTPSTISARMEVTDSTTTDWDVSNIFETFVTLRGSY